MADFINRRPGIREVTAVRPAWRAEIWRHGQRPGGFEPVAVESHQHFRPAAQPAGFEAQRRRLAADQLVRGQSHLTGIVTGPDAVAAADVQGMTAGITFILKTGANFAALEGPVRHATFKIRIGHEIDRTRIGMNFEVVHQAFARIENADLRVINGGIVIPAEIQHAGVFNVDPGRLVRFIAVAPVRGEAMIGVRIQQFQTAPAARRPLTPASAGAIRHLILDNVNRARSQAVAVGAGQILRQRQRHALAIVRKSAAEISQRVGGIQIGILCKQIGQVVGDDEITVCGQRRVRREAEGDAGSELPVG